MTTNNIPGVKAIQCVVFSKGAGWGKRDCVEWIRKNTFWKSDFYSENSTQHKFDQLNMNLSDFHYKNVPIKLRLNGKTSIFIVMGTTKGMSSVDVNSFESELIEMFGEGLEVKSALHRDSNKSETKKPEPNWATLDKTALPRQAFADQGEADKKSTWKFPHHWISGGTKKDENGIWKDGRMFLHEGGLNAARSAAGGGRTGQPASAAVRSHLQMHRDALDKQKEGGPDMSLRAEMDKLEKELKIKIAEHSAFEEKIKALTTEMDKVKADLEAMKVESTEKDARTLEVHEKTLEELTKAQTDLAVATTQLDEKKAELVKSKEVLKNPALADAAMVGREDPVDDAGPAGDGLPPQEEKSLWEQYQALEGKPADQVAFWNANEDGIRAAQKELLEKEAEKTNG